MQDALWIYLAAMNVIAYLLMTVDKSKAVRGARRIPERTLLLAAAAGGSVGAWIAMRTRRHKTKHAAFSVGIPVLFVLHAALLAWLYAR